MMFSMDDAHVLYIGRKAIATINYAARFRAACVRFSPVVAQHLAAGELSRAAAWDLGRQIGLLA